MFYSKNETMALVLGGGIQPEELNRNLRAMGLFGLQAGGCAIEEVPLEWDT